MFQKLKRTIRIPAREKPGMNASGTKNRAIVFIVSGKPEGLIEILDPFFKHIHKKIRIRQMRQCNAERMGLHGLRDGDEKKEMPALPSWKSELSKIFSTLRLSGKP